jgi:hypothetical protein
MLRSRIETIAQFYIEFRELYNAVKHGNRVIPEDGFTFEYGLAEEPIHVEEQYICAVCKTSGDHDSGRPYFLHYPADLLVTRSIRLLEWTHDLFSYLKDLHHVTRNETGEDDEEVFTLRFFAGISRIEENEALQRLFDKEDADIAAETTSQSTLETGDYIQISNPDFKAFVPRFESSITPQPPTLAARLSLKGKTIHVEAAEDDEPSPEHPLLMSFRSRQGTTARLSLLHKLDISTEYQPLDFSQYYDFIKIREATQAGEVDYIEFSVGGTEAFREPFAVNEWSLAVPDIGLSQDLIDFITRLEMATEQRIPVPLSISDEQIEILEDNHGPIGSREDALSIIDQIKSSGEKESIIHISVEYEDEHHHLTNQIGDPKLTFTTENGQTVAAEDLPGGGRDISLHYEGVPGTPDWFVDHMKANPEEAEGILHDMIPGDRDSDEEFFLTLDVDLHVQTFWYDESQIVLRPSDQPPDEVSES